jgi:hypothetical protein
MNTLGTAGAESAAGAAAPDPNIPPPSLTESSKVRLGLSSDGDAGGLVSGGGKLAAGMLRSSHKGAGAPRDGFTTLCWPSEPFGDGVRPLRDARSPFIEAA